MNEKRQLAFLQACLAGLMYGSFSSHTQTFFPAPADAYSVLRLAKHAGLSFSHLMDHTLFTFLQADALHRVSIHRFSAKWPCAPGFNA